MKKTNVGGQAVIEGVMMRGVKGISIAVRNPKGEIIVKNSDRMPLSKKNKFFGLPIIRGAVSLFDSMAIGIDSLNFSASTAFPDEDEEPSKTSKFLNKIFKGKTDKVVEIATIIISLMFSVVLFFVLPTLVTSLFKNLGLSNVGFNLIESSIRVLLFTAYIYLISKMDDIYRVFQYHGAEHKAITCYENELDLTVENAKTCSRYHKRCGTNFMFLVMIVSIIVFSFLGWRNPLIRVVTRILLLPLISGITYEILKWLGDGDSKVKDAIAYPGLMLQRLTTKEPEDDMLEVSIRALKESEGII